MRLSTSLPVPYGAPEWVFQWAELLQAEHATRTETANYAAQGHDHTIRVDASAGAVTVTLPAAESVSGKILVILKVDNSANAVTVDADGAELIGLPGAATVSTSTEGVGWTLQSTGTAWDIIARTS